MKNSISILILLTILISGCYKPTGNKNSPKNQEIEKKIDDLLKKMTLEEKIGQMNQYTSRWEMTGPAPGGNENSVLKDIKSGRVGSMLNVVGAKATHEAQRLAVENSRLRIPMIFGYDVVHGYRSLFRSEKQPAGIPRLSGSLHRLQPKRLPLQEFTGLLPRCLTYHVMPAGAG
jgi:beta-glucosidase